MTIFSVENGSFSYNKKDTSGNMLLNNISFEVDEGSLMAVLGPNGAGKTTLLRCMMGFLNWREGASYFRGNNIRSMNYRSLWQNIAYVPQARNAATSYTVEEMVLLGRSSHFGMLSQPRPEDRKLAAEAIKKLGISFLSRRQCSALSGGELQMVLIARALASEPQLLILDEPESNLDFKNQLIILDTMAGLASEGISCIFNTHYPAHALQRATSALLMSKGGSYIFGRTSKVITEENLESSFGVKTVIGEIETPHNIYKDVLPLEVVAKKKSEDNSAVLPQAESSKFKTIKEDEMDTRIAIIGIVVEEKESAEKINNLLHEYAKYIIGRMGMPYPEKDISIISVIMDAPEATISALSGKLGMIKGISIKTTYSKK